MAVQLAEVDLPDDVPLDGPPKKRRRWTLWLALWALVGLGAAGLRHGSGVASLDPGEVGVVQTAPGVPLFSDRVVETPGTHLYAPLLQRFVRVEAHTQATALSGIARTRRGAAVPYADGAVHHRVRAGQVATLLKALGPDAAARERFVQAAAARALRLTLGAREAGTLGETAPVHTATRAQLKRALAASGIELVRYVPPNWRIDPAMAGAVASLEAVRTSAHAHREGMGQRQRAAEARKTQTEDERAGAHAAMRAELETQLELARASLADARQAADLQLERRVRGARMKRDETLAKAKGLEAVARLDAQALAARVDAVRGRGSNLLDKAIAKHVLPQLGKGRKAEPAP